MNLKSFRQIRNVEINYERSIFENTEYGVLLHWTYNVIKTISISSLEKFIFLLQRYALYITLSKEYTMSLSVGMIC